jgi:Mg-chelatase subunit ChlD
MLKPEIKALSVKIASRLIIKVARQIADTGYRSGHLKLIKGFADGTEIELDRSLENYIEEPILGILENIVSYTRQKERKAFVVMLDHSYSMKGMKVVLAAITAASIAQHFKRNYAVLAFSNRVTVLKALEDKTGPETVLERLFALELQGDTDMKLVLEEGLKQVSKFERKMGLILTDGAWNQGGDPLEVAARYDKLSVIGFPPAKHEKIRQLAIRGRGEFSFVEDEARVAAAILKCLN